MDKIVLHKNLNGDTRTAPKNVSFSDVQNANDMHRMDVYFVLSALGRMCIERSIYHDHTKTEHDEMFYADFCSTLQNGTSFIDGEWYKMHITEERHHLSSHCPEDVNLLDVLEMVADCTCAGLTRSGKIYDLDLDPEILQRAVKNTVELITSMVTVED